MAAALAFEMMTDRDARAEFTQIEGLEPPEWLIIKSLELGCSEDQFAAFVVRIDAVTVGEFVNWAHSQRREQMIEAELQQ